MKQMIATSPSLTHNTYRLSRTSADSSSKQGVTTKSEKSREELYVPRILIFRFPSSLVLLPFILFIVPSPFSHSHSPPKRASLIPASVILDQHKQFYNAVLFMGSVAVFSLIAQRMNASK
ncbi:hypothetical protein BD289DRAFT_50493 [Coniella lustricola]|uniref:Uncharacterized protein n=1 Tax=Coniella lustricola TaxID=2025994 RepID=A0A2T3A1G4_9PEZI|nr:hypothetical protein BD289DRAFT_50493 [Coniella lustricola]